MSQAKELGQCRALTPIGNKCPSQAHEEMVMGEKQLVFCSHHYQVIKAIMTALRPVAIVEDKRYDNN